jgi:hypothetical protein
VQGVGHGPQRDVGGKEGTSGSRGKTEGVGKQRVNYEHKDETLATNVPHVQACVVYWRPRRTRMGHMRGKQKRRRRTFRDNHHAHKPSPSYQALTRSKLRSIKLMTRVYVRTRGLFSRGAKLALPSSGSVEVSIYAWDGQADAVEVVGRVSCSAWVWMDARETGFVEGGVLTRKPLDFFTHRGDHY